MMISKTKIAALSALAIISLACTKSEIEERHYRSYDQLVNSDEPGNWIPVFIPNSATEIKVKFKIDTGAELLVFNFPEAKDISLSDHCGRVKTLTIDPPPIGLLNASWWPDSLSKELEDGTAFKRYEIFRCERQAFLALEKQAEGAYRAFYWRLRL